MPCFFNYSVLLLGWSGGTTGGGWLPKQKGPRRTSESSWKARGEQQKANGTFSLVPSLLFIPGLRSFL